MLAAVFGPANTRAHPSEPYEWGQVPTGGGGNITNLVVHPKVKDVIYLGADVGGVDRWDEKAKRWIPTLDYRGAPQGIDSLAVDPSDATGNKVYAAVGGGDQKVTGKILRSSNRGETWTASTTLFPNCANGGQGWNNRLAVDPANGNVIYFAARNGLWRSADGGDIWTKIASAPEGDLTQLGTGKGSSGTVFVILDKSSGTIGNPKRTKRAYLSPLGSPLYKTEDGGDTWTVMPGAPANVSNGDVDPDGILYCSSRKGGLTKYTGGANGTWSVITPAELGDGPVGYTTIQVDPFNKKNVLAMENYRPCYSTDGGLTWAYIAKHGVNQSVKATPDWYSKANQSQFGWGGKHLRFDPHRQGVVWESDAFLTWKTENIYAKVVHWESFTAGHEETVGTAALVAPPSGETFLYNGAADVYGFRHVTGQEWPTQIVLKRFNTQLQLTGADFQESDPNFVAFVGATGWNGPGAGGYTTDGGKTFVNFPSTDKLPANQGGRIAVSATSRKMVWATGYSAHKVYYSADTGATWKESTGLPEQAPAHLGFSIFYFMSPLAADRVNGEKFYVYHHKDGSFYRSEDGGATFKQVATGLPKATNANLVADFTKEGNLWLSIKGVGLWNSTDSGSTWKRAANVQSAGMVGIGKGPNATTPSVYFVGKVNKDTEEHIFRSDDRGATWIKIDIERPFPNGWIYMTGDRRTYGTVYFESSTGIYYGKKVTSAKTR